MNQWAKLGLAIASSVIPGVAQVETIARSLPNLKGDAKQQAVVDLVKASVLTAESVSGKDLLADPDVERATRGVIDAVVALQNIIHAKKAAAA